MSQHETSVNCPFCAERGQSPDTTRNLHISLTKLVYNCFRCGAKPSETGHLPSSVVASLPAVDPDVVWGMKDEGRLYYTTHDVLDCPLCVTYLTKRGISLKWLALDMPSWLRGVYYVGHRIAAEILLPGGGSWLHGRATGDDIPHCSTPLPDGMAAPVLFTDTSHDAFGGPSDLPLVLVEGLFDGLNLLQHGIPVVILFGKSFSEKKLEQLQASTLPDFVVCLDAEATQIEQQQWVWHISKFARVRSFTPAQGDPGSMDVTDIRRLKQFLKRR